MSKAAMNLQDSFLNQVRRENSEVRVLLVNGTLLRGIVKGFDNFTLILNNRNGQHLVYKHAIAQIVSHRPQVKTDDLHGQDQATTAGADSSEHDTDATPEAPAKPASERNQGGAEKSGRRDHNRDNRNKDREQRPKKEGFNTLDLSNVKIGDK
jgi:host factor-I protein